MNENVFEKALNGIAEVAEKNRQYNQGDFYGEDGLLYCGKCRQAKEYRIHKLIDGAMFDKVVGCLCECGKERVRIREEEEKRKEEVERARRARSASLMDERFLNARFENCKENKYNSKNLGICHRYADNFESMVQKNQGLLFWGDVGTGKSFAAACIANQLLENRVSVVMTSFVKLLQLFRDPEEEARIVSSLNVAKLVIFDDLGSERDTNYALEKVYNIIDGRYRTGLPMIVTTNLTMEQMLNETDLRYKRVFDRIFEVCYPMQWTGPSHRRLEAKDRFDEMKKFLGG